MTLSDHPRERRALRSDVAQHRFTVVAGPWPDQRSDAERNHDARRQGRPRRPPDAGVAARFRRGGDERPHRSVNERRGRGTHGSAADLADDLDTDITSGDMLLYGMSLLFRQQTI